MIVKASAAMLAYEFFAIAGRRRTWSQARGAQRVVFGAWIVALIAHVLYEWIADDVARAAAKAF